MYLCIYIYIYIYIHIYIRLYIYYAITNKLIKNTLFINFKFHINIQSSGYTDVILQTSGANSVKFTS